MKDKRICYLKDIEKEIKMRSKYKDSNMEIIGLPSKFLFEVTTKKKTLKIYEVDAEWIRNNIHLAFGIGGHGRVHAFIPNDEVWISKDHADTEEMARTIIHEIKEYNLMAKLNYWLAHQIALKEEHKHPKLLKVIAHALKESKNV